MLSPEEVSGEDLRNNRDRDFAEGSTRTRKSQRVLNQAGNTE